MSQPLKESPGYNLAEVVQTNHTSPYGRLYSILKSGLTNLPSNVNTPEEGSECTTSKLLKRKMVDSFLEPEHGMWCCWQCKHVASSESELAAHIRSCSQRNSNCIGLPGCPFCPRDAFQASDWPFPVGTFNVHVAREHPDVSHLICGYCLEVTDSPVLEDLIHHILSVHKLPWRPSPASLAHLRCDQLPHRVVTCLGCGWCTFVLRASNAAQPPTSLESHLNHCSFSGGRVHLTLLTHEMCASKLIQQQLLEESVRASQSFTQVFPLVRGYPKEVTVSQPKEINLHYRPNGPSPLKLTKRMDSPGTILSPTATAKKPTPKKPRGRMTKNLISKPVNIVTPTAKRVTFDVPVTLPPAQSAVAKNACKKSDPVCLYVCPLCGDNALASLRERDEHLQSAHNGELVFPCQICGLAYPLYIALRRHAALKHNADYDMVRYGPAELLDSEPIECPECHLVAFTDRAVVKLHLVHVHKLEPDQAKSLLRSSLRKSQPGTTVGRGGSTGRRGGRGGKREANTPAKDRTMFARSEKHDPKTPSLSRLERLLGAETGDPAPASCHLCHTTVDNAKEFRLHMELDHIETDEDCEQLGCQACGRIFFGPGGRIDLIGHLRVLHQDADHSSALSCPHAEQKPNEKLTEDGNCVRVRPCEALFSSPRLRQVHSACRATEHPGFACPMSLELPECENQDALDLPEQLCMAIMETETAADRAGLMILAYCCPNCSRLFAGFQAPTRFANHRLTCHLENKIVAETVPTISGQSTNNTEAKPTSSTKLLESVLRNDPELPLKC